MAREPANILRLSDQDLIDVVAGETTVVCDAIADWMAATAGLWLRPTI